VLIAEHVIVTAISNFTTTNLFARHLQPFAILAIQKLMFLERVL